MKLEEDKKFAHNKTSVTLFYATGPLEKFVQLLKTSKLYITKINQYLSGIHKAAEVCFF